MTYPFLFDEQHQSSGAVIRGRSRKNVIDGGSEGTARGRITSSVISIAAFGRNIQKRGKVL